MSFKNEFNMKYRIVKSKNGKFFIQKKFLGLFWVYYKESVFLCNDLTSFNADYFGRCRHVYKTSEEAKETLENLSILGLYGPRYHGYRICPGWDGDDRIFVGIPKFFNAENSNRVYSVHDSSLSGIKERIEKIEDRKKNDKLDNVIESVSQEFKID